MGKNIADCVSGRDDCRIIAGIDLKADENSPFPIYTSADKFNGKADVIIDFSHPSALDSIVDYAVRTGTPAVIATTGLSAEQRKFTKRQKKCRCFSLRICRSA